MGGLNIVGCMMAVWAIGATVGAQESFLRAGDRVMWIGDSITAQNLYEALVDRVLQTLYPEAGITMVNCGVGNATAPSRFAGIPEAVTKEKPSIMTVMFGVNDTGWATGNEAAKIETYSKGLQQYADLARQKGIPLLFLRETHFSHVEKAPQPETELNAVLMKLFEAQDKVAAGNNLSVVDVHGAYRRELARAWKTDPKYEFTPGFVHPTTIGHTAVAGEILKALGAGLPLAKPGTRGSLHLPLNPAIELMVSAEPGVTASKGVLTLRVQGRNLDEKSRRGEVIVVIGTQKFTLPMTLQEKGVADGTVELPASALLGRWECLPIYMVFRGGDVFAAAETPLYYSRLMPTDKTPFARDEKGWVEWDGVRQIPSTVGDIRAVVREGSIRVEFSWKDSTPVAARLEPSKARISEPAPTPLNDTSCFSQPCDAVEIFLDLRDTDSTGRWTSSMESIPDGTCRVGLYRIDEGGKPVAKLQVFPRSWAAQFKLQELAGDRYAIEYAGKVPTCGVGLNMRVTDAAPNKTSGANLTSVKNVGPEYMDYFRLTAGREGIFCRIGY